MARGENLHSTILLFAHFALIMSEKGAALKIFNQSLWCLQSAALFAVHCDLRMVKTSILMKSRHIFVTDVMMINAMVVF